MNSTSRNFIKTESMLAAGTVLPLDKLSVADIIVRGVKTCYRIGVYPKQKIFEIRDSRIENVYASTTYEFVEGKPINLKVFVMNTDFHVNN